MITNQFIPPHPLLQPLVSTYILSTSHGSQTSFRSHWAASNEINVMFYLGDQPEHSHRNSDAVLSNKRNCVMGLSTRYNGVVDFKGQYHTFIIQFEVNGINKLFNIPMHQFTDRIYAADEVFGKPMNELHDQLSVARTIRQMTYHADTLLLSYLHTRSKEVHKPDCAAIMSQSLNHARGSAAITQCADIANMSVKTFERTFSSQTGVFPKLYMQLLRFNEALKIKTIYPSKSFTSIAHECGYFDQMHFIKEFKKFTDFNPRCFIAKDKTLSRPRIDIRQNTRPLFSQLNRQLTVEEFVSVSRTD